jgi:gliding motility-associated protein GldM
MSSGKETPRQKMIGMMYLVLTALLALNVSKEILKGFVTVDESIEKSKAILDENNGRVQKAFEDYVKAGNFKAQPYLLKAIEAQKELRLVDAYIDSVKLLIVQKTEDPSKRDTSQLRFMEKLDDYDTPTYLLLGSDEASPITTRYSAKDLRLQLDRLYGGLTGMLDNMQKNADTKLDEADLNALKQKLATIKPVDRNLVSDGVKLNWELENFYNMPMAAVITNLNKIQADMKNVESEVLHVFGAASGKFEFKFNKVEAKVISPTAYVLSGQPFKADIVLSASSSDLGSDRMKVLIGAEYDTLKNQLSVAGSSLSVAGGMGKFESMTSATGQKNLKGVVVFRNARGVDEFYPFDYSYMVAPPFTAVSADNMNIFYAGVDNPMSASSAGFSPSDLRVTVSGCGAVATSAGPGKYTITAKSAGSCTVTVAAQVNGVYQQQGAPKVFRVKDIPPPVLKMAGKLATTNLEMSRNEIGQMGGIGAESPGFMFAVNMPVKSFDVFMVRKGKMETYTCTGNNFSSEAKVAMSSLRSGDKLYIENAKVQKPTGMITLPSVQIKVKS